MDDLQKVKPKLNYEWYQDQKSVTARLQIKGTSSKKIDVFISDLILKVNVLEKKFVRILDLQHEVDFQSKENKIVYANEILEVTMLKKEGGLQWTDLIVTNVEKEVLKKRREESFQRQLESDKAFHKNLSDIKVKYDTQATREQMKQEDIQRVILHDRIEAEKKMAEAQIYDDLEDQEDESAKDQVQSLEEVKKNEEIPQLKQKETQTQQPQLSQDPAQTKNPAQRQDLAQSQDPVQTQDQEQSKNQALTKDTPQQQPQIVYARKTEWDIFNSDDIRKYEQEALIAEQNYPKTREKKKVDIHFTEKIYPMVAAREQHFKDAPMPRVKQGGSKANNSGGIDNNDPEAKNPLWLKDKGDEFYRNKDFYSAINAYNQAFRLDGNFVQALANRSACHLNLFNYEECIVDCEAVIDNINQKTLKLHEQQQFDEEERTKEKYSQVILRCSLRKAICLAWKGSLSASQQLLQEIKAKLPPIPETQQQGPENELVQQIEATTQLLRKREETIQLKLRGDAAFRAGKFDMALTQYQAAFEADGNETALANISASLLQTGDFQKCIEVCDKCIAIVKKFTHFTTFNTHFRQSAQNSNSFLIKLYLRKSKALQELGKHAEGLETVKLALQIDELNEEARKINAQLEKARNREEMLKIKELAAQHMKEGKAREALDLYSECLKKIDASDDAIEYLAILLNRCACFLHLLQYEDIISTSLRGLKIIRSFKNRVISWENNKLTKEQKEKLTQFESRFLIRRANAYLKQNSIYNAKSDLEEALKIDPNNDQLKEDLKKVQLLIN